MNSLKQFRSQCKGSVAAVFAIAVLPLLVGSGVALDYSRAASRRNALQTALDAAILSVARDSATLNNAQMTQKINAYLQAAYGTQGLNPAVVQPVQNSIVAATASASVPTTIMNVVGIKKLEISVTSKSSWSLADVVIAVDVSAGMGQSMLDGVKSGINTLFIDKVGGTDDTVKIGLVPYATRVRVDAATYRNAPWICYGEDEDEEPEEPEDGEDGLCEDEDMFNRNSWVGYITDRPSSYDQDDTYYNNQTKKKYPAVKTAASGETDLRNVVPLTSDFTALKNHINTLTAGGKVNGTIGVSWGHSLLSTIVPFEARPTSRKILIVIAGGKNEKSRHTWVSSHINTRMLAACTSAKASGIEIYTVRLGTAADANTLRSCATNTEHFFDHPTVETAQETIEKMALTVRQPKLTH